MALRVLATCTLLYLACASYTPDLHSMPDLKVVKTFNSSTLYSANDSSYNYPFYIADIKGETRYEIGYSWARLVADKNVENWKGLLKNLLQEFDLQILVNLLCKVIDWQWYGYLSKAMPPEYMEELEGIEQGMKDAGYTDEEEYLLV